MSGHRARQRIGLGLFGAFVATLVHAGFQLDNPGSVRAIIIQDSPASELAPLADALLTRLGASEVEPLVGAQLHAERIEEALRRGRDQLTPHDTLIVYVGLPLAASGVDILATAGFDETKPWTGLPIESVLAALIPPPDAVVVVIFPSCGYQRSGDNVLSKWPVRGVTYCVAAAELPGVPTALRDALLDAAGNALQGTSGTTGLTRSILSNWELAQAFDAQLRRRVAPTAEHAEELLARPVGTVRLVMHQPSDENSPSRLAEELVSDSPPMPPAKRFAWWIDRYRLHGVAVDSLVRDLTRIVRDPEYATHAVLAVRALAELAPEHHRGPLADIFATAETVEVKRECILHFSLPLPDDLLAEAAQSDDAQLRSAVFERALLRQEPGLFTIARDAALADPDEQVRIMALRAATTLASPSEALQVVYAVATGKLSHPASIELTNELIVSLGPLPKTRAAVAMLLDAIANGESSTQTLALYALGNGQRQDLATFEARVLELLQAKLLRGDTSLRTAALNTIGRLEYSELGKPVLEALRNESAPEAERAAAVDALGTLKVASAVPDLARLTCLSPDTHMTCVSSASLRAGAIAALGKVATDEAVDVLWHGVSSSSPEMRRHAIAALEAVASQSTETIRRLGPDSPPEVRSLAIKVLSATGQKLEVLVDAVADPDAQVREAAIFGLQLKEERSPQIDRMIFERAANAHDPFERTAYTAALGRLGDVQGLERLSRSRNFPTDTLLVGAAELPADATTRLDQSVISRWVTMAETPQARSAGVQVMYRALESGSAVERAAALLQWKAMAKDDPEPVVREAAAASIRAAQSQWD